MAVDWNAIRDRLKAAADALERGVAPSREEAAEILKARARALAEEEAGTGAADGGSIEILEFRLAFENYGIASSHVREVCPLKAFTPLPGVPPFVLGIVNVRGRIFSVIDLKRFFELPDKGLGDLNKVIILGDSMLEFGILSDEIAGVRPIRSGEIQPPLPTLTGTRQKYLKGVGRDQLVMLDAEKLLADRDLIVHQESAA